MHQSVCHWENETSPDSINGESTKYIDTPIYCWFYFFYWTLLGLASGAHSDSHSDALAVCVETGQNRF